MPRRLKDILGNLNDVRTTIEALLSEEYPDIVVNVRDINPSYGVEKCKIELIFDLRDRIEDLDSIEEELGVDLHRPAGPYDFAYYDHANKKPFVIRDRRDNKRYRTTKQFIIEHFTKGVPKT